MMNGYMAENFSTTELVFGYTPRCSRCGELALHVPFDMMKLPIREYGIKCPKCGSTFVAIVSKR